MSSFYRVEDIRSPQAEQKLTGAKLIIETAENSSRVIFLCNSWNLSPKSYARLFKASNSSMRICILSSISRAISENPFFTEDDVRLILVLDFFEHVWGACVSKG
jgi:hypothetical protein